MGSNGADPTGPLARAAAANDQAADEEGSRVPELAAALGLDIDELVHVAEQRAVRSVLFESRGLGALVEFAETGAVLLTEREREKLLHYGAAYMDGITLGWRAAREETAS